MTHAPIQRSRQAGVTLLEMLLVVVILGIVAGTASMAAGEDSVVRLDLAAMQVRDTVDRARALAFSNRLAHGVVFDTNADRLALIDGDGNMVIDPLTQAPMLVEFTGVGQPQGVDITAAAFGDSGSSAIFDAQGVAVDAGSVVLEHGGQSVTLSLDAATGRMQ